MSINEIVFAKKGEKLFLDFVYKRYKTYISVSLATRQLTGQVKCVSIKK